MKKANVLIVEEKGRVAKILENMLNLGVQVSGIASSREDALTKARECRPELVLLDVKLNGTMDAFETANKIQELFHIPVIFLTDCEEEEAQLAEKAGETSRFLRMPFDGNELQTTIGLSLSKKEMEKNLDETENWAYTVLRSISEAVIATDQEGLITFMNPVAEALTGMTLEDAMGKLLKNMISFIDEKEIVGNDTDSSTKRADEASVTLSKKAILVNKIGREIPVYYGSSSVRNGMGNIIGDILVIRDIREEMGVKDNVARRMKELKKVMEGTIQAVSLVVETRDSYTAEHQKRVARLACAIGEEMGLSEAQKNCIFVAGGLHDIGKIYLPTEILNEPDQLSGSEYSSIMNHPQVGYDILKEIEFPWPIAQIVLQHHEKMDGSGYPLGYEGEEILLEARILAVADVVEAMSSERPYRQALGIEKALGEISRENRLAYDEEVVDACLRLFRKKGYVFECQ